VTVRSPGLGDLADGGSTVPLSSIGWVRVMRPWRFTGAYLRGRRITPRPPTGGRLLGALDPVSIKLLGRLSPPPPAPSTTTEPMTPAGLVEHLPAIADRLRLHLDYDERYVAWLLRELAAITGLGTPVARLVRGGGGRVLGWYVYCLVPGGISRVLQIAAADQRFGPVLDDLLHHAWSYGSARLIGRLQAPLAARRTILHHSSAALAASRDEQILGAIATGRSLLTRLDGEWWIKDERGIYLNQVEPFCAVARVGQDTGHGGPRKPSGRTLAAREVLWGRCRWLRSPA
jgi:hypothetical protein